MEFNIQLIRDIMAVIRKDDATVHVIEDNVLVSHKYCGHDIVAWFKGDGMVYIYKSKDELEVDFVARKPENTVYYQVALTTRGEGEDNNKILERELTPLKKINDNYPKYILTLDDDLDADFDGIKKINVLDWLLDETK